MSKEPAKNPFAPPDPNAPPPEPVSPPPAPTPRVERRQEPRGSGPSPSPRGNYTPPSPEVVKKLSRSTLRFGAALILSLLASQLPLPYTLVAPVLIIATVVLGVIALRGSWAISPRNLMTPMLIAGIAMALMMSVTVASKFILWPIEMERQECVAYAITNTAQAECEAAYQQALTERLESLRGATGQ